MRFQEMSGYSIFETLARIIAKKYGVSIRKSTIILHRIHKNPILAYKQFVLGPSAYKKAFLHSYIGRGVK